MVSTRDYISLSQKLKELFLTICFSVPSNHWGSIGIFKFDIVAWICGGQTSTVARIIYTLVGLAALWCISLLFRSREAAE